MKFTKMHGIGNDYVFVNCFEETVADPAKLSIAVSDRHFGIGSDGLILILPSDKADARMRIFNADGSEAQMCGNGVRCVAKYIYEHGIAKKDELAIDTLAGVRTVQLRVSGGKVAGVRVNMGAPKQWRSQIPMKGPETKVVNERLQLAHSMQHVTCVSMGNPHCVIYADDVGKVPLAEFGPEIEHHPSFPERTNVHFVQVESEQEIIIRTWERGSGITLACGTGASACCVAGVLIGKSGPKVLAHLPGGDLELEWENGASVYMTGPATEVFSGEWPE
ncbi:MAG TPA: diaminopimelate epimerase [Candidatus Brocadiia bacterium]|nr:diaminopimelate epimerase [Candidatus Brocadiia bacterium]